MKTLSILVACAALAGGCAVDSARPPSTSPDKVATPALPLMAHTACVEVMPVLEYEVQSGNGVSTGNTQRSTRMRAGDLCTVTQAEFDAQGTQIGASLSELSMRVGPTGDFELVKSVEHADAVITTFDPPMLLVPRSLDIGQKVVQNLRMIVAPIGKPNTVKTRGPATQEVELIGAERISTPAGDFDTLHTKATLRATLGEGLGTASVTITTEWWFVPSIGVVAQTQSERATVLGISVRSNSQRTLLKHLPPGAPPASSSPAR